MRLNEFVESSRRAVNAILHYQMQFSLIDTFFLEGTRFCAAPDAEGQWMHTEDSDADKPQNGRGISRSKRRRSFGELTEGWSPARRRRVRKATEKQQQAIAATAADPATRLSGLAVVDLNLGEADARTVADALANPPKPTARLSKAARRRRKLVAGRRMRLAMDSRPGREGRSNHQMQ